LADIERLFGRSVTELAIELAHPTSDRDRALGGEQK
jgi:hypothetical protein